MPIMYVKSSSIDPDVSHPTSFHGSSIRMDNAYKHRSRPVHSGVELARMHFARPNFHADACFVMS